jgi:phosphatidylserine decarboxylase
MARLADLRLPRAVLRRLIRAYVWHYSVDLSEAAEPAGSFPTFNAFFTRRLRADARPVDPDPDTVVSPADARLQDLGELSETGALDQVKGRSYTIEALLGSGDEAALFRRGVHATLYLSPSMYHRVHSPVAGAIRSWRYVPGRLFPVNTLAVRHVPALFTVNERVAVLIDSDVFGPVAVVLVGAANVGRITLTFADLVTNRGGAAARVVPAVPIPIGKGEELGAFNLGSTVIVLAADPTLRPAAVAEGELLKVGQALWRRGATDAVHTAGSSMRADRSG